MSASWKVHFPFSSSNFHQPVQNVAASWKRVQLMPHAFIAAIVPGRGSMCTPNGESGMSRPQPSGRAMRVNTNSSGAEARAPPATTSAVTRNWPVRPSTAFDGSNSPFSNAPPFSGMSASGTVRP